MDLKSYFDGFPPKVRRYAVVGWPLSHTLSPAMHNAAIRAFGLNAVYRAVSVDPKEWEKFLSQADGLLQGFNVTVPYKERVAEWSRLASQVPPVYSSSPWSEIGAVNTLLRTSLGWEAHNTDVEGFFEDCASLGISFQKSQVLLIGSGGAARAILLGFGFHGRERPASLYLTDVFQNKANLLAEDARVLIEDFPISVVPSGDDVVKSADIVINATPVGLKPGDPSPVDLSSLRPGAVVYDLIYHRETAFRLAARARGAADHGGLGMLVRQGALAFELWFGEELKDKAGYSPAGLRRIMGDAARTAMKERGKS